MFTIGEKVKIKAEHLTESLNNNRTYTVTCVLIGAVEVSDGNSRRVIPEGWLDKAE